LPFVCLFVSFYIRGIKGAGDRFFFWGSFFMGIDVGLSLNSRPVDGIYGALGALFCFIYSWYHHRWLFLLDNALIAILGCGLPFAIIYPLAQVQGFLKVMLTALFVQNFSYLGEAFVGISPLVWDYKALAIVAFFVHLIFYFFERRYHPEDKELAFFFALIGCLASLFFVLILGYGHYFQSGFGFLSIALLYGFYSLPWPKKYPALGWVSWGSGIFQVVMAVVFLVGYWGFPDGIEEYSYRYTQEFDSSMRAMKAAGAGETGDVYALDADCAVYLDGGFVVNERYMAFQRNWIRDNPDVLPEIRSYLKGEGEQPQPDWLIVNKQSESFAKVADIVSEDYELSTITNTLFDIYVLKA
jgi:hypothetical protein